MFCNLFLRSLHILEMYVFTKNMKISKEVLVFQKICCFFLHLLFLNSVVEHANVHSITFDGIIKLGVIHMICFLKVKKECPNKTLIF